MREEEMLFIEGFCGCIDDDILEDAKIILKTLSAGKFTTAYVLEKQFERKYFLLLLNALTEAGLLEHGSNIRGSWITDKGKTVLLGIPKEQP